jgi:hypothetical protein
VKRILFYGLAGGVSLPLLKILEYQYFVRAYPGEVYRDSSRLFDKLGVNRRVQAVQKGRELRLLP